MIESERVYTAVDARLRGDGTLTALLAGGAGSVIRDWAKEDTAKPYVLVALTSAVDVPAAIGATRLWQDTLILTKAIGRGAQQRLLVRQIADRIDVLLDGYATVVDGVEVVKLRRESAPPQAPDVDAAGVVYPQINQVFRSEAVPA